MPGEGSSELIFGLAGAAGTNIEEVVRQLKVSLHSVAGYDSCEVRLSRLIHCIDGHQNLQRLQDGPYERRVNAYMDAGNQIRERFRRSDGVAALAAAKIRVLRTDKTGYATQSAPRFDYILNSLKHPTEVETLRLVYGAAFHLVSVYQSHASRRGNLIDKITRSYQARAATQVSKHDRVAYEEYADNLMEKDEKQDDELGQRLRDVFPLADFCRVRQSSISTS